MKYQVIKQYLPPGKQTNRPLASLNSQGLVLHETDTPGATAQNEHDYFAATYRGGSAHYFIDPNVTLQVIPENEQAWHAGATANRLYLSIEMCRPAEHDQDWFDAVWDRTVDLAVDICIRHEWNTDPVWSHRGISEKYGETDHTDPIEYLAEYGKTWQDLLNAIAQRIKGGEKKVFANLVVYKAGSADEHAAKLLADAKKAPLVTTENVTPELLDCVENIYMVGGTEKLIDRAVLIAGADRFKTAEEVLKFIGGGK